MRFRSSVFLFVFIILAAICESKSAVVSIQGKAYLKNSPYAGLSVTAHWFDSRGIYHSSETWTLYEGQAIRRGSSSFTGFYFFEKGTIVAEEGTNIVLSFGDYPFTLLIKADPLKPDVIVSPISFRFEGTANATQEIDYDNISRPETFDMQELESLIMSNQSALQSLNISEADNLTIETSRPSDEENITFPSQEEVISKTIPIKAQADNSEPIRRIALALTIILVVIFIVYLAINYAAGYISGRSVDIRPEPLAAKRLLNSRIRETMKKAEGIEIDSDLKRAIEFSVNSEDDTLFLFRDSNYIGFTDVSTLARNRQLYRKKLSSEEIAILKKDLLLINPEESLSSGITFFVNRPEDKFAVAADKEMQGELSISDIQRAIKAFFRNPGPRASNPPQVRDAMKTDFMKVKKDADVEKVMQDMLKENKGFCIVEDNEKVIGIFTKKDYLRAILQYDGALPAGNIGLFMSTSLQTIDPDINLFEANEFMLEKGFKNYPVIVNGELLGVMTHYRLLEEIYHFLSSDRKENGKN